MYMYTGIHYARITMPENTWFLEMCRFLYLHVVSILLTWYKCTCTWVTGTLGPRLRVLTLLKKCTCLGYI